MLNKSSLHRTLPTAALSLFLALAPVMGHAHAPRAVELPPVKPAEARGAIVISGSATVYALTVKVGEQFKADGFADKLNIEATSTGKGIESFCKGEIDIANASRAMTADEAAACKSKGREPLAFMVGVDAVVIAVSRNNRFVDGLSKAQVEQIFSGKVKTWKELNAKWPAEKIIVHSPGTSHGTYDYLTEALFKEAEPDAAARKTLISGVPGMQLDDDINRLAKSVNKSNFAIGYFGYAFYAANRARLRVVTFEGVMANDKTVPANQYAMSRPLFLITSAKLLKEKPQVAMFVNYYLANVSKLATSAGYFLEPDKLLSDAKSAYLKALQ